MREGSAGNTQVDDIKSALSRGGPSRGAKLFGNPVEGIGPGAASPLNPFNGQVLDGDRRVGGYCEIVPGWKEFLAHEDVTKNDKKAKPYTIKPIKGEELVIGTLSSSGMRQAVREERHADIGDTCSRLFYYREQNERKKNENEENKRRLAFAAMPSSANKNGWNPGINVPARVRLSSKVYAEVIVPPHAKDKSAGYSVRLYSKEEPKGILLQDALEGVKKAYYQESPAGVSEDILKLVAEGKGLIGDVRIGGKEGGLLFGKGGVSMNGVPISDEEKLDACIQETKDMFKGYAEGVESVLKVLPTDVKVDSLAAALKKKGAFVNLNDLNVTNVKLVTNEGSGSVFSCKNAGLTDPATGQKNPPLVMHSKPKGDPRIEARNSKENFEVRIIKGKKSYDLPEVFSMLRSDSDRTHKKALNLLKDLVGDAGFFEVGRYKIWPNKIELTDPKIEFGSLTPTKLKKHVLEDEHAVDLKEKDLQTQWIRESARDVRYGAHTAIANTLPEEELEQRRDELQQLLAGREGGQGLSAEGEKVDNGKAEGEKAEGGKAEGGSPSQFSTEREDWLKAKIDELSYLTQDKRAMAGLAGRPGSFAEWKAAHGEYPSVFGEVSDAVNIVDAENRRRALATQSTAFAGSKGKAIDDHEGAAVDGSSTHTANIPATDNLYNAMHGGGNRDGHGMNGEAGLKPEGKIDHNTKDLRNALMGGGRRLGLNGQSNQSSVADGAPSSLSGQPSAGKGGNQLGVEAFLKGNKNPNEARLAIGGTKLGPDVEKALKLVINDLKSGHLRDKEDLTPTNQLNRNRGMGGGRS